MKLLFIIGSGAVGKMTVGQELMKITDLKLFHNHMAIEPILEVFGSFNTEIITKIRNIIFEEFAKSENYGMIFTYMWAFDMPSDWDYVEDIKNIFIPYGTEFYCVELVAPQEIRLMRNATDNRLNHKKSKQNLDYSNERLLTDDSYRLVSLEGEVPFDNYMKIDNTDLSPSDVAERIKDYFNFK